MISEHTVFLFTAPVNVQLGTVTMTCEYRLNDSMGVTIDDVNCAKNGVQDTIWRFGAFLNQITMRYASANHVRKIYEPKINKVYFYKPIFSLLQNNNIHTKDITKRHLW